MKPSEAMIVDLNDVYVDQELNNREKDDPDYTARLASQIESTGGLLQPIGIYVTPPERKTEHGKPYELGFGFQRVKALNLLAEQHENPEWITAVSATLKDEASLAQRHVDQLIENLGRKDLTPMETALAFKKALDDTKAGLTMTELARKIAWPVPTVSNYLKVAGDLSPKVIDLVLNDQLTFSKAKEIVAIKPALSHEAQEQLAATGASMTHDEFVDHVKSTYKQTDTEGAADEAAPANGDAAASPQQRPAAGVRANVVRDKYLPKLLEDAKGLKGQALAVQNARIDTMKFILNEPATELGAALAPWEAELQAKADAEAATEAQTRERVKYVRALVTTIDKDIKAGAEAALEGKPPVTLAEAMARAKATVEADLAKAKESGLGDNMMPNGFPVESVDKFMEEVAAAHTDHLAKKKKQREAAAAAAAKREAEAKAKEGTTEGAAPAAETPVAAGAAS